MLTPSQTRTGFSGRRCSAYGSNSVSRNSVCLPAPRYTNLIDYVSSEPNGTRVQKSEALHSLQDSCHRPAGNVTGFR